MSATTIGPLHFRSFGLSFWLDVSLMLMTLIVEKTNKVQRRTCIQKRRRACIFLRARSSAFSSCGRIIGCDVSISNARSPALRHRDVTRNQLHVLRVNYTRMICDETVQCLVCRDKVRTVISRNTLHINDSLDDSLRAVRQLDQLKYSEPRIISWMSVIDLLDFRAVFWLN